MGGSGTEGSRADKGEHAKGCYHDARLPCRAHTGAHGRGDPEGVADELILVDDASRDATAELARRLGLRVHVHPENRGYGGNQKSCYTLALAAGADIVVLLHPDYQYEPKAVPLLMRRYSRARPT